MEDEHGALETSHSNYTLSVVGAIGSMLLFGFIIFIAYVPNRPEPVNEDIITQRKATLAEVRAAQNEAATTYAWINKEQGTVRIPVSQAMTLAAKRLAEGKPAFTANTGDKPKENSEEAIESAAGSK